MDSQVRTPLSVLADGRRIPIPPGGLSFGRADENDVVIDSTRASRRHARIWLEDETCWVEDLGSANGTWVNGQRLGDGRVALSGGDTVSIGDEAVRLLAGAETTFEPSSRVARPPVESIAATGRVTIGRDAANDLVLGDANVSRFHAEVAAGEIRDLGSRNGTRLNGASVRREALKAGDEIGIGAFRLVYDGERLAVRDDRGALRLEGRDVSVDIGSKRILQPTSILVEPGELVALIGASGSGKTTLMKVLAGVAAPTRGEALVNGEPVGLRLPEIGYVPQDDIVHRLLTVEEALRYGARLRLPYDVSDGEIEAAVQEALGELSLEPHAQTLVGSLSGGQRKRVSVAMELLSKPGLLFLDEPTSGLDPHLETRTMRLLDSLSDAGRAVVTTTHNTKNLGLCDKVGVMAPGGRLAYFGPPEDALDAFGVEDFDDIYVAVEEQTADDEPVAPLPAPPPAPKLVRRTARGGRDAALVHGRILAERYLRLLLRDRRNLVILLGQVPILALLIAGLFSGSIFEPARQDQREAAQLLFLVAVTAVWLGAIDAAREIIKERSVFERERAVGVGLGAYLASKLTVLAGLVAAQIALLAFIVFNIQPLHADGPTYAAVLLLLFLSGLVAACVGLLVSAFVHSEDQASSLIPLVLIPQLLLAGSIKPVHQMSKPVAALSVFVFTRWAYAGLGSATNLDETGGPVLTAQYGTKFFSIAPVAAMFVLVLFGAATLAAVLARLRRS